MNNKNMGEISDMMLSGVLCCQCGSCLDEDIQENLDFPVMCVDCFNELSPKEKKENNCEKDFLI